MKKLTLLFLISIFVLAGCGESKEEKLEKIKLELRDINKIELFTSKAFLFHLGGAKEQDIADFEADKVIAIEQYPHLADRIKSVSHITKENNEIIVEMNKRKKELYDEMNKLKK